MIARVPVFGRLPRRPGVFARLMAAFALFALAACEPIGAPFSGGGGPRVDTTRAVQVALLVPGGSGQSGDQALAAALENAARLAIRDLGGSRIDLRVYNDSGRADIAARMAVEAVNDGAQIILGPVFGDSARAAGAAIAASGVNVLSFSNNTAIAGGNVFVLGSTFDNTASRLASYAVRQGRGNILVVHERNESGNIGRTAIERAVAAAGGRVAAVQGFDFSQQGVVAAVPQIAAAARSSGSNAIFLTSDSAGALPLLAQLLPENAAGPDVYQYIGLTRWDIPVSTLSLPGVQGGWFAMPDPTLTAQFNARYRAAYGADPHPIAALAYDGIAAIGALLGRGPDALTRAALTQGSGFAGVTGVFRLLPDGTNQRGLAVAQIRDNQVFVIDPAPRSFTGPGF